MNHFKRHLKIKRVFFAAIFATTPLITSCKKAPPVGEAFITNKHNEVRLLADEEIRFYGSDFPEQLTIFRQNVVANCRRKALNWCVEAMAKARAEKSSLESSKTTLVAKVTEETKARLTERKSELEEESASYKNEIASAVEKAQKELNERLEKISDWLVGVESSSEWLKTDPELTGSSIAKWMIHPDRELEDSLTSSKRSMHTEFRGLLEREIDEILEARQIGSTRTGGDGKFSVPPQARYISAYVETKSAGDMTLFWLVKINMDETTVKLSNSNITSIGEARLKALEVDFR